MISLFFGVPPAIRYVFLFFGVAMQGDIAMMTSGYFAHAGYLALPPTFFVALLGDIAPDIFYFGIGKKNPLFLKKYGRKIGLTKEKICHWNDALQSHKKLTIVMIKLTPYVAAPAFIALGVMDVSWRLFVGVCFSVSVFCNLFFVFLGYRYGEVARPFVQAHYWIGTFSILVFVVLVAYCYQKAIIFITKQFDKKSKKVKNK
ncbi:MAG TPA: hypothetical protein VFM02_00640 [Candidatus Paceibacterota bacterium]|nr:hypothetical protein [Candidatus Paceibacterota bacterium]